MHVIPAVCTSREVAFTDLLVTLFGNVSHGLVNVPLTSGLHTERERRVQQEGESVAETVMGSSQSHPKTT